MKDESIDLAKEGESVPEVPTIFLLLENPSKSNNLGPILRCASAFGILNVIAIGYSKCAVEGSHGASKHVRIISFPVGDKAVKNFLRTECKCASIVGLMGPLPDGYDETGCPVQEEVLSSRLQFCHTEDTNDETMKRSFPVDDFEFKPGNVCFAISKMRQGLPVSLSKLCDSFVHIPHSNICAGVEPLLDSPSCLTILLHVYTNWAGYTEHTFQGHKFDVVLAAPIVHNDDARKERVVTRMANELASDAIEMGDLGVALLWNPFDATASDDGDY